jgi:S-adenosylmethionine:tRNA ribosyltransferase-isomerase
VPSEKAEVTEEVWDKIKSQKSRYQPIVAVGTTSARTLETLARRHPKTSFSGEVSLTISPPQKFRLVDRLLSNFHLPESSLLLLASAFSGRKRLLSAYEEAVKKGYRFYSYGDLTLLE